MKHLLIIITLASVIFGSSYNMHFNVGVDWHASNNYNGFGPMIGLGIKAAKGSDKKLAYQQTMSLTFNTVNKVG